MSSYSETLVSYLKYGGLSKSEYQSIANKIVEINQSFSIKASALATLTFAALYIVSFIMPSVTAFRNIYLHSMLAMAVVCIMFLSTRKHKIHVMTLCYAFLLVLYVASMVIGLSRLENIATAFCVFLVALPLMIIEKPYKITILTLSTSIVFCLISFAYKPRAMAVLDLLNVITFELLGAYVNVLIVNSKVRNLINEKNAELERDTDYLTGTSTRSAAEYSIARFFDDGQGCASLLMLDIDDFKAINDTYGHNYGDEVLKLIGSCLKASIRKSDIVCRFGGDEFIIFLPNAEKKIAERKAMQIIENVSLISENEKVKSPVAISLGTATYPTDAHNYQELFKAADEALYKAKTGGKNQCVVYEKQE